MMLNVVIVSSARGSSGSAVNNGQREGSRGGLPIAIILFMRDLARIPLRRKFPVPPLRHQTYQNVGRPQWQLFSGPRDEVHPFAIAPSSTRTLCRPLARNEAGGSDRWAARRAASGAP